MSYIQQIATAVPTNRFSQETLAQFYSDTTSNTAVKRKIKIVAAKSGIAYRYSVLNDFNKDYTEFEFFSKAKDLIPEPSLSQRMAVFRKKAIELSLAAIGNLQNFEEQKPQITHLITVTCTGLFAPGLDIELIRALGLRPTINRSSVNFMGCNAAILALKQAAGICNYDKNALVLVVCTELCTIHFQKQFNEDYLLSNLLFADGSAAVLISGKPNDTSVLNLKMNEFHSTILHNGYADMAWQLSETGFIMNLTSYIPNLIKENIQEMLDAILVKSVNFKYWAVHPGGKKIIDVFVEALGLTNDKLNDSYTVLREFGNMSSPTVLFVLKAIMDKVSSVDRDENIFMVAFGPGVSIESLQLQYV